MERVFPLYQVRFISVNDGYDSKNYQGDTGGMNVAFKYLAAEFYSRDLSVKSTTAKLVKMKRGEYQSTICPYGYKKAADGTMEPDEETAPNVRLLFDLACQQMSSRQIAQELFRRGIPTPGQYRASKGLTQYDISRCGGIWHTAVILRLLRDERYIGTYVARRSKVTEVGSNRSRARDESEWIKIPAHHPSLVSQEQFDKAQTVFRRFKSIKKNINTYPLRSKVFCGCCSHSMTRTAAKAHVFYCRFSRSNEFAPCCNMTISESELEDALYEIISKQAQVILGVHELSDTRLLDVQLTEQSNYERAIEQRKAQKTSLYERLIMGEIDRPKYQSQKADIDRDIDRLEQAYSALKAQTAQMRIDEGTKKASRELAQEIQDAGKLTASLADATINRVYVYPGNRLEVEWKVREFFSDDTNASP